MTAPDLTQFNRIGLELLAHLQQRLPAAPAVGEPPLLTDPAAEPPRRAAGRVILVSSTRPGEGKTFVAQGLARALAEQQEGDVLWVDAAFSPTANAATAPGLAEVFAGGARPEPRSAGAPRLWQLGQGAQADPALLYRPAEIRQGLDGLRASVALVVLDAPCLEDCGALLAAVDACVLVVDARHTPRHAAQVALARARLAPGQLAGVVLNHRPRPLPRWLGGE